MLYFQEIFVQKIAESYGIPFFSRHLPEELRKETSLQVSSRNWRRQESQKLAAELGQQLSSSGDHPSKYIICTAHTHDDNIETLIMKLLRGVHLSSFQGVRNVTIIDKLDCFCCYNLRTITTCR